MSLTTDALAGTFVADPVHSSFHFALTHMQVGTFRASFDDVTADVVADGAGVRLEGRVSVASISIRNPPEFREHVLNGADFFDGAHHPEVSFRSGDVRLGDDGTFSGDGELTIKGITKPIVATGTYQALVQDPFRGQRTSIELNATVDRRDWGMDWQMALPNGDDALGWDVTLSARIELVKQG